MAQRRRSRFTAADLAALTRGMVATGYCVEIDPRQQLALLKFRRSAGPDWAVILPAAVAAHLRRWIADAAARQHWQPVPSVEEPEISEADWGPDTKVARGADIHATPDRLYCAFPVDDRHEQYLGVQMAPGLAVHVCSDLAASFAAGDLWFDLGSNTAGRG